MHHPGILEKNREVPELVRFFFCFIKVLYHRKARVLAVRFGKHWGLVISDIANWGWITGSDKYYPCQ